MTDMLSTITSYIPTSLMRLLLEQEAPPNEPTRHVLQAAVLFADVSGFTPLTEALAQKGDEGPEEITRLLNRYFGRMITLLEAEGGDVVKFSGDALTVLFVASDEALGMAVRRALQAAHAMQEVMQELAPVETSVGPVELALKVGIGGGEVLALQVGGVFRRWEYVITGEGLLQAALAEGVTARGGVTLSPEMESIVHPSPLPPRQLNRVALDEYDDLSAVEARLKRFLPGAVRSWMVQEELHDWLGVLRSMSVLFIGVAGIDYNTDGALSHIHTFLRSAQETIYRYQGSINKLAVDDKGTIFLVLFGAPPFAHADDPLRAVRCALDLAEIAQSQGLALRTGITTGRVFAGPVGSDLRREYTVMGDAVNLAARLMGKADANQALCDLDTHQATIGQIAYDALPPVMLKGKALPTPIFRPKALLTLSSRHTDDDEMIGRKQERDRLLQWAAAVQQGTEERVLIEGDAGIGKSLLLRELQECVEDIGFLHIMGAGQSLEQLSSYWVWRSVFSQLFGLRDIEGQEAQQQHVTALLESRLPSLALLPLLNEVLAFSFPDNEVTRTLEPAVKQESLRSLLVSIIVAWAETKPLCLVIEDLQWLDSLSWELLLQLSRALHASSPRILLIASSRPIGAQDFCTPHMASFKAIESLHEMTLPLLSPEETLALVAARLATSPVQLPGALKDLIFQRSDGNPLFAGELLDYLQRKELISWVGEGDERRCLFHGEGVEHRRLPDSLEGLLLARIDQLPPGLQLILKVASVVGRRFSFPSLLTMLRSYSQIAEKDLQLQLESLQTQGLTVPEISDEVLVYLFKNLAIQEVTYRTLLYQQRRELHRTFAEWIEQTKGAPIPVPKGEVPAIGVEVPSLYLPALCHHWRCADVVEKELWYTRRTAQHTALQYANAEAIQYCTRALELIAEDDLPQRFAILLEREALLARLGQRDAQREDLDALSALVSHLSDKEKIQCALREVGYNESTSAFKEAFAHAEDAASLARKCDDFASLAWAIRGCGAALLGLGKISEAQEQFHQALEIARQHQLRDAEAATQRLLGNSYAMRGEMHQALKEFQAALLLHEQLEDHPSAIRARNNIGLVHQHFGEVEPALQAFEQALQQARELGSPPLESLVIGNLAISYTEEGLYQQAEALLKQALRLSQTIDSSVDIGMSLLFLGENLTRQGAYIAASDALQKSLSCGRDIGHRYMEGYALLYLAEAACLQREVSAAQQFCTEAIAVAEAIEQRGIEAEAWLLQGYLYTMASQSEDAQTHLDKAEDALASLELSARVMEAKAAKARLSLGPEADPQAAMAQCEAILVYLDESQSITGMREPFWVLLTCLQALCATQDKRFSHWLALSLEWFARRIAKLDDEATRQQYLAIPHHQALQELRDTD